MGTNKITKGDQRVIRGWTMYDWANSVYNLVISSAIFPIFYDTQTKKVFAETKGVTVEQLQDTEVILVNFFGVEISSTVLYSFVLSASFLVVSFLSPFLSGIADYTGSKKKFLKFFLT